MSDTLPPVDSGAPTPAFLSRLRDARYQSPSGAEFSFLFDELTRSGPKKAAAHEIADSNDSVLQDLGGATRSYPIEAYFAGENYDLVADAFFESMFERYTPDSPGILRHPRWGDIPVMPFGVEQREVFAGRGGGIARVSVDFRQTVSRSYPTSSSLAQGQVAANIDALRSDVDDLAGEIDVEERSAYSRFRSSMQWILGTITEFVDGISEQIQDIQDEVTAIEQDILTALALFASPAIIISQIGNLIFGTVDTIASLPGRVELMVDMTESVVNDLVDEFRQLTSDSDRQTAAQTTQAVGALAVAASGTAALNTEFSTRESVGNAIDGLGRAYTAYREGMDQVQAGFDGQISSRFIPNHNLLALIYEVATSTNQILINRAFDLKTKKTVILSSPSDAISQTWELYGDLGRLEFFLQTNRIVEDEFFEIPSGRELVAFV